MGDQKQAGGEPKKEDPFVAETNKKNVRADFFEDQEKRKKTMECVEKTRNRENLKMPGVI